MDEHGLHTLWASTCWNIMSLKWVQHGVWYNGKKQHKAAVYLRGLGRYTPVSFKVLFKGQF
jgi:hypothetical protein